MLLTTEFAGSTYSLITFWAICREELDHLGIPHVTCIFSNCKCCFHVSHKIPESATQLELCVISLGDTCALAVLLRYFRCKQPESPTDNMMSARVHRQATFITNSLSFLASSIPPAKLHSHLIWPWCWELVSIWHVIQPQFWVLVMLALMRFWCLFVFA